jgi:malate dehydrogenase (quinone)
MVDLIERCFKDQINTPEWEAKLKNMIPSYKQTLNDKPELLEQIRKHTAEVLKLNRN